MLQASTDSSSPANRKSIADELNSIADSIKMLANSRVGNDYIMSGERTDMPAYDPASGSDVYQGDSGTINREITAGVQTGVNVNAKDAFGDNTQGLIKGLRDAAAHLLSGTPADITLLKTTDVRAMDTALETVTGVMSKVGAIQNRIDFYENRINDLTTSNNELLSMARDTDIARASADYAQRQAALTAALKTGQGIVQPSLIDFLK